MKPLMMAALVVQLTSAGGAGSGRASDSGGAKASSEEVGKHFSALKNEVSSLAEQFREARERVRLESERKQRETEGTHEPQPAVRASAASGASPSR